MAIGLDISYPNNSAIVFTVGEFDTSFPGKTDEEDPIWGGQYMQGEIDIRFSCNGYMDYAGGTFKNGATASAYYSSRSFGLNEGIVAGGYYNYSVSITVTQFWPDGTLKETYYDNIISGRLQVPTGEPESPATGEESIEITKKTYSSISVNAKNLGTNQTQKDLKITVTYSCYQIDEDLGEEIYVASKSIIKDLEIGENLSGEFPYTFSGLADGTTYKIIGSVSYEGYSSIDMSGIRVITTAKTKKTETITFSYSASHDAVILISLSGFSEDYSKKRDITITFNGESFTFSQSGKITSYTFSPSIYYSNLLPSTSYSLSCSISYDTLDSEVWSGGGFTTIVTDEKPKPTFNWTYPKISGNEINVYASEWNDLIDFIDNNKNGKLGSAYKVSKGDYITGSLLRGVAKALGSNFSIIDEKTFITASFFNALEELANKW